MLHEAVAVIAGFLAMTILVMAGSVGLMAAFVPGGLKAMKSMQGSTDVTAMMQRPSRRYYVLNITLSFIAAVIGALTTAHIATLHHESVDLEVLALLVVVMGFASAATSHAQKQPRWYRLLIPIVGLCGVAMIWLMVTV